MFPLNDINIVACAVATFSAAVGYNVSRRRGRNQPNNGRPEQKPSRLGFLRFHRRSSTASARSSSSSTELESECDSLASSSTAATPSRQYEGDEINVDHSFQLSDEAEHGSLKRKRSPSPAATMPEDMSPPAKRRRTPSVGPEDPAANVEQQHEDPTVLTVEAIAPNSEPEVAPSEDAPGMSTNTTEQVEAPVEAAPEAEMQLAKTDLSPSPAVEPEAIHCEATRTADPTTPSPSANRINSPSPTPSPSVMSSPSPKPQMPVWHATGVIVAAKPSSAFQAFSGQPSAFATSSSSWACTDINHSKPKTPVWSTVANANTIANEGESEIPTSDASPLAAPQLRTNAQKVPVVTGEEDEDVMSELKGAKVFVKRGERDFCEGILGHARLLKQKTSGAERILFRREPVWKVSMSVRLRPTVRCSFDEAQGALRVMLKEPVLPEDGVEVNAAKREQVVIYALRRGKASRTEFAAFAKAVVESARLQDQAGAGVDASA